MYEKRPWLAHYGETPASLDYPESSIFGMLASDALRHPKAPALEFMGRTSSKARLLERVARMSRAFAAAGMRKGDRVIICLPNIPQAVVSFYALSRLGALPAPIHPLSTPSEIQAYAGLVQARWAITLDGFFPRFAPILGEGPIERTIVCSIGGEAGFPLNLGYALGPGRKIAPVPYGASVLSWRELESGSRDAPELALPDPLGPADPALILFSGGSTGEPKAILLSNLNCNALAAQTNAAGGPIEVGDAMLSILPMFHGFGLAVGIHAILVHGGQCVLVPRFKADSLAALVRKYRPAFMAGVPTLYDALASDPDFGKTPLSCFKGIFCGGDSLPPEIKYRFEEVLRRNGGAATLREGYGMTESVTANMLVPAAEYRERSIGLPYPDMLAKIVRPGTTEECAPMVEGEICVCGPTVMLGYLGNPEATAEVLKVHPDGRTWLHSGDIGCMDSDGFFYFRQRAKRIIKTSGIAVYPSQVEDVLNKHPAVRLSCVIGVPHPTQVEVPKGFVTLNEGFAASPDLERGAHRPLPQAAHTPLLPAQDRIPRRAAHDPRGQGRLQGPRGARGGQVGLGQHGLEVEQEGLHGLVSAQRTRHELGGGDRLVVELLHYEELLLAQQLDLGVILGIAQGRDLERFPGEAPEMPYEVRRGEYPLERLRIVDDGIPQLPELGRIGLVEAAGQHGEAIGLEVEVIRASTRLAAGWAQEGAHVRLVGRWVAREAEIPVDPETRSPRASPRRGRRSRRARPGARRRGRGRRRGPLRSAGDWPRTKRDRCAP